MIKLAADENFNNNIIRGLRRRSPALDIVRIQDTELSGADDPVVLEWASQERRVLLTHDSATMPQHAYERVHRGQYMSGVFLVALPASIGLVVEHILILAECSLHDDEWVDQVVYLPLT